MKKYLSLIISFIFFAGLVGVVKAKRPVKTFSLPSTAKKVSENTYYLGSAKDKNGKVVEGYAFLRKKENNAKPPWAGGGKPKAESKCYEFLAKGAKWKTEESWIVNGLNLSGISESFILDNLGSDIEKWEASAGAQILGTGSDTSAELVADTISPDNQNEVYFSSISDSGTIAVTIIWGIFGGPPQGRELVEWDQVYSENYLWSDIGEDGKMDFENIATHELGHSVGLGDLYNTSCGEETMYGYAGYGETNKRDLNPGDIAGIKELYK